MVGSGHCGFRDVEVPEVNKITDTEKQSVLPRMPEYSVLITGAQVGAISPSRGHAAMSGDDFGCYHLENTNGMQQVEPKGASKEPQVDGKPPHGQETPVSM